MTEDAIKLLRDPRHFAVYSRKSKQSEKGDSIKNQMTLAKNTFWISTKGHRRKIFLFLRTKDFPVVIPTAPHYQEMMKAVKKNMIKAIVVYRLDRITRSISDFSDMYSRLTHMNVAFISQSEEFDTSTPMGRAMMHIATVFAQLERETTALRIRDNMHGLSKTGRWLGGTTPTGYKSVGED